MDSLNKQFDTDVANFAQKALDYYYDNQLNYVIENLDHATAGRNQWRDKGMKPLYRNITKHIVSKSGLLYKDGLPVMEVHTDSGIDEVSSFKFNSLLEDEQFLEFMMNFDVTLRLLKTGMVLTTYDDFDSSIKLHILHRGNTIVHTDHFTKRILRLVMRTGTDGEYNFYREFTNDMIVDYREKIEYGSKPEKLEEQTNPYGMVPVVTFYDTHLPRTRHWVEAPRDLILFNDAVNMNLVDLDYAASWGIHQTLFTNMLIVNEDGDAAPADTVIGGLGKVINVDTTGVDAPYLEYKGPIIDLDASKALFETWMKNVASDWSVNIKPEGLATQSISGFSLIVQEKDNLELRQQRQRMSECGLVRFYKLFTMVYNTHNIGAFNDQTYLVVNFEEPQLPFDESSNEDIWAKRIEGGRASVLDYLMAKYSITREEAMIKHDQIKREIANSGIVDEMINNDK